MTCCRLPKLLGLSYAVVPDAVIITLIQIPGIICGSCQQTHDYSYYCCITVAGIVPALDFHHKVKTHAGQTKKRPPVIRWSLTFTVPSASDRSLFLRAAVKERSLDASRKWEWGCSFRVSRMWPGFPPPGGSVMQ